MNISPLATATARTTDTATPAAAPAPTSAKPAQAGASTDQSQRVDEPSREEVTDALKHINEAMQSGNTRLEFSLDDDTSQTIVKIVDQNTKEVVRQIPSVEALAISKSLNKMAGLFINQQA